MVASLGEGINVIDTSINYLGQRAEKAIGKALKRVVTDEKIVPREAIFLATKAGFIPRDSEEEKTNEEILKTWSEEWNGASAARAVEDGEENYPKFPRNEIVNGKHCIAPACLDMSIKSSLKNLGVSTIDLLYLHNVENQFKDEFLSRDDAFDRLTRAFERLEWYREHDVIKYYGLATWNAFRSDITDDSALTLHDVLDVAEHVGGTNHGFRFIQLPLSVNLPEAAINEYMEQRMTFLEHASNLGITVIASRSIDAAVEKRIANSVDIMKTCKVEGLDVDHTDNKKLSYVAEALNMVRSTPGIALALVGMKSQAHIKDNLGLLSHSKLAVSEVKCVMEEGTKLRSQNDPKSKKILTRGDKRTAGSGKEIDPSLHNGEDASHTTHVSKRKTYAEYLKNAIDSTFATGARAFQERSQMGDDTGDDKDFEQNKPREVVPDGERKTVRLKDKVKDRLGREHTRGKASRGPKGIKKKHNHHIPESK